MSKLYLFGAHTELGLVGFGCLGKGGGGGGGGGGGAGGGGGCVGGCPRWGGVCWEFVEEGVGYVDKLCRGEKGQWERRTFGKYIHCGCLGEHMVEFEQE